MKKRLVIVGGGHAHLTLLAHIDTCVARGHRVTVVNRSAYHYYSGMGPGLLAGTYSPRDVRFHIRRMAEDRGAAFIEDAVVHIDAPERSLKLASGATIPYDIASFNTGSEVPAHIPGASGPRIFPVKPIANLVQARQFLCEHFNERTAEVVVIGGGPAGLEMAGNIWKLAAGRGGRVRVTLLAGRRLMARFPDRVRMLALRSLQKRGIEVVEGSHAAALEEGRVIMDDGTIRACDAVFLAMGVAPSTLFRDSKLPTGPDGGLLVNRFLQCPGHPGIFGGGDCISLEGHRLAKVGVYAVRQNPVLMQNICAALNGGPLVPFVPQKHYLLIFNLGDGTAILNRNGMTLAGRFAWRLKDRIDRAFMRKFQLSGELDQE
ncbi:MAG: NAD(P)/FAD-dependent oxidoreductase [Nitrospirota bacterium]